MKLLYFSLLLGALITSACSKSEIEPEQKEKKKQQVTFKTEAFEEIISELKAQKTSNIASDDTLKKYAPKLYCQIYKFDDESETDGSLVFNSSFKPTDSNFGTISTAFEPGHYVAIIVASGHPFYRIAGLGGDWPDMRYSECHFNTMTSVALPFIPVDQIFYKKVLFTVEDQAINKQVILTRIVAGLDVVIKDVVPTNITSIQVIVDDAPFYSFYNDNSGGNVDKISGITPSYTGANKISTYVLASGSRSVQIIAYAGEQIVAQKNLTCMFFTNKKTRLEGSLFSTNAAFNVTVDPAWETPPPVVIF
ncbi:hypothetical protein [Desertivirga arenae]|uniref:hypothetical protein n=1 Tax=Desertivirga arenae TaxID=2810309 RepID=UPI001A9750D2|nr:hypothetical protein [Pedobacter sp. SYSU D00823]